MAGGLDRDLHPVVLRVLHGRDDVRRRLREGNVVRKRHRRLDAARLHRLVERLPLQIDVGRGIGDVDLAGCGIGAHEDTDELFRAVLFPAAALVEDAGELVGAEAGGLSDEVVV